MIQAGRRHSHFANDPVYDHEILLPKSDRDGVHESEPKRGKKIQAASPVRFL